MAGLPGRVSVTGDYRWLRLRDMPRVAWLVGRAFGTRLPAWIPVMVWNALLWPARMMILWVARVLGGTVFVAPAAGPIHASVVMTPSAFWSPRVAARLLATFALVMVATAVLALLGGVGLMAALAGAEGALLMADYLLRVRDRPHRGGARPPAADVTLGPLVAWPMGRGHGVALMGAALADRDQSWPGAVLCLQPAHQRLARLYEQLGFQFAPESGWMLRPCGAERSAGDQGRKVQ